MHCLLLNVTKMLWQIWTNKKALVGLGRTDFLLSEGDQESIQKSITTSVSRIPYCLGTIPRAMSDSGFFKAAQWKAFLSVFGTAVMYEYLPPDVLSNFCDLQTIWCIVTMRIVNPDALAVLKVVVKRFVRDFEKIYYNQVDARLPVCTINIHWTLHLPDCIIQNGSCAGNWSYPIERYAYEIKLMAAAKQHLNTSISNQSLRIEQLNLLQVGNHDIEDTTPLHLTGRIAVPDMEEKLPLSLVMYRRLQQVSMLEIQDITYYKQCKLPNGRKIGSKASQQHTITNRDDYHVAYMVNEELQFGSVYGFLLIDCGNVQHSYALLTRWTDIQTHADGHVASFGTETGVQDIVHATAIQSLVGILNGKGSRRFIITSMDQVVDDRDSEDEELD
jgi:hypothetical protein